MKKIFFILFSLASVSAFGQTYGNHNAARFTTLDGIVVANGTSNATSVTDGTSGQVLTTDGAGGYAFETIPTQVTFGTDNQIPFVNAGGTGFDYDANFTWNGSIFSVTGEATVDNVNLNGSTISATGATDLSLFLSSAGTGSVFINSTAYFTNGGQLRIRNTTNQISLGAEDPAFRTIISAVAPSATRTYTIPDFGSNDSFVGLAATQALTNKTYNGLTISGSAGTLTIPTSSSLIRAGAHSLTLTTTGTTNVTLPTSGTLLGNSLTSANIFVGNGSNVATGVAVSGDIGLTNTGVASISSGVIVDGDVNASAAIAGTKIAPDFGSQNVVTTGSITGGTAYFITGASGIGLSLNDMVPGSIRLTNSSSGTALPSIVGKSTDNAGLNIVAGANDTNVIDMLFNVRESDNTDFTTLTSTAFSFRRFSTDLITVLRNGNTTFSGSVTGGAASFSTGAFSGNVTFDTNTMFVDAANNRVGIGTAAPSTPLELSHTGTNLEAFRIGDASTVANNTGLYLRSTTQGRLSVGTGASFKIGTLSTDWATFTAASGLNLDVGGLGIAGTTRISSAGNFIGGTATFSGQTLIGISSARSNYLGGTVNPNLQVESTGSNSSSVGFVRNSNDTGSPLLFIAKTRGTVTGSNTVVQNNDILGRIRFAGADGTNLIDAAEIKIEADGTPGTNDMPGRIVFSTTADGASSPTEAMRINSSQNIGIGTTDLDGTPAIGRLTVNGSTADGSTNIFVGRDSGEANVFSVDTDGDIFTASRTFTDGTNVNTLPTSSGTLLNNTDFTAANGFSYTKSTITIASADVLNLNSTPIEIIPAPGVGKYIIVDKLIVTVDYNSSPYNDAGVRLIYAGPTTITTLTGILTTTQDTFRYNSGPSVGAGSGSSINSAISVSADVAPTGGNSPIKVTVFYWIGEI